MRLRSIPAFLLLAAAIARGGPPEGVAPAAAGPSCWAPCPSPVWVFKAGVPSNDRLGVEGAAAGIGDGKIYVSHGRVNGATTELRIYDIATDTWTKGPDASLPRIDLAGALVGSRFHAIGGWSSDTGNYADVEAYDVAAGTWGTAAPMPTARTAMGIAVVGGKAHVIGGSLRGLFGPPVDAHEVYDPATDTWTSLTPPPVPVGSCTSTAALDGKIYVLAGYDGRFRNLNQIYDIATDTWSAGAPVPDPRRFDAAAGVLKGRIVFIGGADPWDPRDDVDVYDPATDTWCEGPRIPFEAAGMAAPAPYDGRAIYAIGLRELFNPGLHQALVWTGPELTISCPTDLDLECPADTDPAATGTATAQGGCVAESITFTDREEPDCGGTKSIFRTFTATDGVQKASCLQTIHLLDRTPPSLTAGTLAPCFATAARAEAAALAATLASDTCSEPVALTAATAGDCAATVTVTGTDACGNRASVDYGVRIDGTPPAFLDLGPVHGACLWPPDHRMVCFETLAAEATVEDNCPGAIAVEVAGVASDQLPDGHGDGRTEPDFVIVGAPPAGACLRAERQGGEPPGRTYTIELTATDTCGNRGQASLEVRVPHDRGPAADCGANGRRMR